MMLGLTNPGSPRAGVPKSHRMTSPARISDIARRRVKHGPLVTIKRGASELSPDQATTFPSHQLVDLGVVGEPLTISELAESIPRTH